MVLFYSKEWNEQFATLSEEESHHCTKVLRKKVGDQINCTNGLGYSFSGVIDVLDKKETIIKITETHFEEPPTQNLHIAIAPTKNAVRIEWLVEKCTEIGVQKISFIITKNTERKKLRVDRLEKIALSAMKQSLRFYLPSIEFYTKIDSFVNGLEPETSKYICHYNPNNEHLKNVVLGNENVILIGPEGDFTPEELSICASNDFKQVNISEKRMRTETAAILATSIFNLCLT